MDTIEQKKTPKNKKAAAKTSLQTITPQAAGHFSVNNVCAGTVALTKDPANTRITFEIDFQNAEAVDPAELTVDLVVGPANWQEHAQVYEVKAIPVTGNIAAFDIPQQEQGSQLFYARLHTANGVHFINKDGKPYENFSL